MGIESEQDRQKRVAEAERYRFALKCHKHQLEHQAENAGKRVDACAHRADDFYGQTIRSLARLDDPENPANNFTEQDKSDIAAGRETHDSVHEKNQNEIWRAEAESKKTPIARSSTSTIVMQGDTRGLTQRQGLHTPTMAEIAANARKPDPTAPYRDPNSETGQMINPLEPHLAWKGDFVVKVDPLKPGPKISGLG